MDMIDINKSCETESALEFWEQSFVLTEEQKRAVLQQKVILWTNAMTEEIQRETETPAGVLEYSITNWIDDKRRQFNEDWNNDNFLCPDEEFPSD